MLDLCGHLLNVEAHGDGGLRPAGGVFPVSVDIADPLVGKVGRDGVARQRQVALLSARRGGADDGDGIREGGNPGGDHSLRPDTDTFVFGNSGIVCASARIVHSTARCDGE